MDGEHKSLDTSDCVSVDYVAKKVNLSSGDVGKGSTCEGAWKLPGNMWVCHLHMPLKDSED